MDALKIDYEGRTYTFDISGVTASEWKAIRHYTGYNPFGVIEAVGQSELESIEALFWLVMRQAMEPAFDMGAREFAPLAFLEGWNEANKALDDKKAKQEPGKAGPPLSSGPTTAS